MSASQRAMVAVEFEKVFAEEAKKRQIEAGEKFGRGKVQENLPEPIGPSPQATDEAGDLFNVSGRTVRDANGGKQLPHGRLNELSEELGRKALEFQYRMRFAETYPEEAEVLNALSTYGSWREIIKSLPPKRSPEPAIRTT